MTVASNANKNTYDGNDSTTTFPITFPTSGIVASEIKVYITDSLGISTEIFTNFTTDLEALTVEYPTTGSALATGDQIVIVRELPFTQTTDLKNQGHLDSEALEVAYDRLTYLCQQLREVLDRTASGDVSADEFDTDALIAETEAIMALSIASAAAEASAAAASAVAAAASAASAQGTVITFTDASLAGGILTITHNLALSSPYILPMNLVDNNQIEVEADEITFLANTITIDLGSYGALAGTWGCFYGGSPASSIPLPDPTGEVALNLVRVNAAQTAYETYTYSLSVAAVSDVNTGTLNSSAVTPDSLAGSNLGERIVELLCFNYTTEVSTGDGAGYFVVPSSMTGMNLVEVHAQVITAGVTGTTDIQLYNLTQTADILSTKITIDSTETGSDTAATPAVINAAEDDLATYDVIRVDIDSVSNTAPEGLIVTLIFRLP